MSSGCTYFPVRGLFLLFLGAVLHFGASGQDSREARQLPRESGKLPREASQLPREAAQSLQESPQNRFTLAASGAVAVQTIEAQEATLIEGFGVLARPQASGRLSVRIGESVRLRAGFSWITKGAAVLASADTTIQGKPGAQRLKGDYMGLQAGIEYGIPVGSLLSMIGTLDATFGKNMRNTIVNTSLNKSDHSREIEVPNLFSSRYWGLDLGLALHFQPGSGIAFRLTPVLEMQLNRAFETNLYIPRFVGFAPRLEILIPLQ